MVVPAVNDGPLVLEATEGRPDIVWRCVIQRKTQDLLGSQQVPPLAHCAKESNRFHEDDIQRGRFGQTRQHSLYFRPALPLDLHVQSFADRAEEVVVEVVDTVQTAIACLQVISKPVRFARFQEGEHGAFILRELAEDGAQSERGEWVQRVATREQVVELPLGHALWSELQQPCLLAEGPKLFLTCGGELIELARPPAIGIAPRR